MVSRLSVIIPNYNYGNYVGPAIESALNLDWPDVEVIVVDDGSQDNSRAVILSFGDRITAIFQINATQRVACNVGFVRSTGDAVLFLDSDDMIDPSLAKEAFRVWRPGLSKIQFQMMRIDQNGRPLKSVFPTYNPMPTPAKIRDWASRTTAYPTPPGSGNLYAREFLERLFPLSDECGAAPDSCCLAAAPFLGDVETVPKPLVFYRVHGRNDSDLMKDETRFAREISRASARYVFTRKFRGADIPNNSESLILNSLEVLQFRICSMKLKPELHPLPDDNWIRAFRDTFRLAVWFPAATWRVRLLILLWGILALCAPKPLARRLIARRYASR